MRSFLGILFLALVIFLNSIGISSMSRPIAHYGYHPSTSGRSGRRPGGGSPPPPLAPLKIQPIPRGYRIVRVSNADLRGITFGEETGVLHEIEQPALVLVSPDDYIVGIIRLRVLLRLYFTVLHARNPVKVHLTISDDIKKLSTEELRFLPFHKLIGEIIHQ